MVAYRSYALVWVLGLQFVIAGCSTDGDAQAGDAGVDGASGGSGGSGGGLDFRDRPDAATAAGDPLPPCADRFSPLACGAGQECDVVIRRAVGEEQFSIYSACVDSGQKRGLGDPCVAWGGFLNPYQPPGLIDEVFTDPCAAGLFCAPDPDIRGLETCQTSCDSGRFNAQLRQGCPMASQYCTGPDLFQEVCRPSDDCDPRDPGACGEGQGCYLRFSQDGTGALAVCLPTAETPTADGEQCAFINSCAPGSSCWGPSRLPPSRWQDPVDYICRPSCTPSVDEMDSGVDGDGGVAGGDDGCPGTASCLSLADSLDLSAISAPLGQCESD